MEALPIKQLDVSEVRASTGHDAFTLDEGGAADARLTQTALSGARELMGVALDFLPFALLFHSAQGVLFSNGIANQLLESEPGALIGQHLLDLVGPDDLPAQCRVADGQGTERKAGPNRPVDRASQPPLGKTIG